LSYIFQGMYKPEVLKSFQGSLPEAVHFTCTFW
jgi:hypothetical protein